MGVQLRRLFTVKGKGLYGVDRQASRISAIRDAADRKGIPLFINARTDVYLGNGNDVEEALKRGKAYANAGASGFFVPGVRVPDHIRRLASETPIPVNVMVMDGVPSNDELAKLGVARVSYGASLRRIHEHPSGEGGEVVSLNWRARSQAPLGQGCRH